MVAIVHQSRSLRNALHYNEHKVRLGAAELLHAGNYPKDTELLSFTERFNRLQRQTELSTTIRVNTVHISLNFADEDKVKLNPERLKEIADNYMQKIGFGEQPYLVYKHTDAGHDHLHIVTTNVQNNGKGISLHNLAKDRSLKAAQTIEKEFGLSIATDKQRQAYQLAPVNALKIQYGRFGTKRAITNVLDHVLPKYNYASVAELNAVLKLYNVMADTGGKGTRIEKNGGLVYRVLNDKGEKVGVPVKASLIYNQPTLKVLEEKFIQNKSLKEKYKQRVKNAIDYSIKKQTDKITLDKLEEALKQESIRMVLRQNTEGRIYGLTFVDIQQKCVLNGRDLGKAYAANGLLQRLDNMSSIDNEQKIKQQQKLTADKNNAPLQNNKLRDSAGLETSVPVKETNIASDNNIQKAMDILFKEEYAGSLAIELQNELKRRRRKKLRPQ